MSAPSLDLPLAFWIGALLLISACAGFGLTYAAFFSDRGFQFGMKTIMLVVTGMCVLFAFTKYTDEASLLLCGIFLAVTVPIANCIAVAALLGVIWYRKKTGSLWGKQEIEPYVGPVRQKPVDVVQKKLEHRR